MRADAGEAPPAVGLLLKPAEDLRPLAECIAADVRAGAPDAEVSLEAGESTPGSGSLPAALMPSLHIRVRCQSPAAVARELRESDPALFALIRDDSLVLDVRTLLPGDREDLVRLLGKVLTTRR